MDYDRFTEEALPLEPDREYDLPGGEHLGHAAALNVPCSEGPATYVEPQRAEASQDVLMAEESPIEPSRQMEAGTEYDAETERRLEPLFTPLKPRGWPSL